MNSATYNIITTKPPPVLFTENFPPPDDCDGTSSLTADLKRRKRGRPRLAFWNESVVSIGGIFGDLFTEIFLTSRETRVFRHPRSLGYEYVVA